MKLKFLAIVAALMPLFALSSKADEPYKYNELYYQRASLFDQLPVYEDDIVFLGNSLTQGCEWHELFDMPNIKNRGINGDVIAGIKDRVRNVVVGHPKKIFLLTGANDISHHLTADSISRAYLDLIEYIRLTTPQTKLYVESVLPLNNSIGRYKNMAGKDQVVVDINKVLAANADKYGYTYINAYDHFVDGEGNLPKAYTNDGLHLMGAGYLHWKNLLLPYVKE